MMSPEAAARALLKACRAKAVKNAASDEVLIYLETAGNTEAAALSLAVAQLSVVAKHDASINTMATSALYLGYLVGRKRDGMDKRTALAALARVVRYELEGIFRDEPYERTTIHDLLTASYEELGL